MQSFSLQLSSQTLLAAIPHLVVTNFPSISSPSPSFSLLNRHPLQISFDSSLTITLPLPPSAFVSAAKLFEFLTVAATQSAEGFCLLTFDSGRCRENLWVSEPISPCDAEKRHATSPLEALCNGGDKLLSENILQCVMKLT